MTLFYSTKLALKGRDQMGFLLAMHDFCKDPYFVCLYHVAFQRERPEEMPTQH